eukprot:6201137-Pleurochrysis_carterae.AAC.4
MHALRMRAPFAHAPFAQYGQAYALCPDARAAFVWARARVRPLRPNTRFFVAHPRLCDSRRTKTFSLRGPCLISGCCSSTTTLTN